MSEPIGAHAVPDDETGPSDLDLVERTRAGDSRAFAELWNRHSRAGRTVARSFSYDADDIVSESFAKVLQAIRNGGGPTSAFRPYLFSTIRNVAMQLKRGAQIDTSDELDALADPTSEEAETLLALDKSLTAQAFRSLPTRWQEALWYSEVEQLASHEIAPLLGMTSNAVSALTFRAREGLRQAWIGAHLTRAADTECAAVIEKLGSYTRGSLGARETRKVQEHLASCAACSIVGEEARDVGSRLALVLLPLAAGIAGAAAYTVSMQGGGSAAVAATAAAMHAGSATSAHAGVASAAHAGFTASAHAGVVSAGHAGAPQEVSASTGVHNVSPHSGGAGPATRLAEHGGVLRPVPHHRNGAVGAARRGLVSVFPRARTAIGFGLATAAAVGAAFLLSPALTSSAPSVVEAANSSSSSDDDQARTGSSVIDDTGLAASVGAGAGSIGAGARTRQNGTLVPNVPDSVGGGAVSNGSTSSGAGSSTVTRTGTGSGSNAPTGSRGPGSQTSSGTDTQPAPPVASPPGDSGTPVTPPPTTPEATPDPVPSTEPTDPAPPSTPPTPPTTPPPTAPPGPPAVPPAPEAHLTPDPDGRLYPVATGRAAPGATVEVVDLGAATPAVDEEPDQAQLVRSSAATPAAGSSSALPASSDTSVPAGVVVAEARADSHGAFTISDFDGLTFGEHRLVIRQVTSEGVRSPVSSETSVSLSPLALVNPQPGSSLGGRLYIVDARGDADAAFEQLLDGVADPRSFTLNSDGNFSGEFTAGDSGTSVIALRYTEPGTGRHGPSATAEVTFFG